ncbi:MAG: Gfo/Idh/MocA family oxidoreductase [Anaerolineae bacterium]|nr:Gfo/Idh/MocA family oxidoreductase [Anaerolineae bacterium]
MPIGTRGSLRVALVGLGFGAEFAPIYLHHPDVWSLTICDADERALTRVGDRYQIPRRCPDLRAILDSPQYDAVHLVTPIPLHAKQTLEVLESGKHCACTVPMATSLADLQAIVAAQRRTGKTYMMMETAVYTREFLFVKEMLARGELGRIQFLRGAHYQDMEGWPPYWRGLPPMHYATHAVSPLLALAGRRAVRVHCYGSGHLREELQEQYGNPYPIETAIFQLEGGDLAAEVTRSLFQTPRAYQESFAVYGEEACFEWQQLEHEDPVLFTYDPPAPGRGRPITARRVEVPDRQDLLPPEIARFTRRGVYDASNPHLSFLQGGGHGGSHPHLVHEFVRSIAEGRPPYCDATTAANWTAPGICAHESAMRGGEAIDIPAFAQEDR